MCYPFLWQSDHSFSGYLVSRHGSNLDICNPLFWFSNAGLRVPLRDFLFSSGKSNIKLVEHRWNREKYLKNCLWHHNLLFLGILYISASVCTQYWGKLFWWSLLKFFFKINICFLMLQLWLLCTSLGTCLCYGQKSFGKEFYIVCRLLNNLMYRRFPGVSIKLWDTWKKNWILMTTSARRTYHLTWFSSDCQRK